LPEPPQPVLVYDRVAANRRATRRLLALFTVLILPFVAGLIPLLTPVIYFGVLLPVFGKAAFERVHSTVEGSVLMFATTATLALLVVLVAGIAVAWFKLEQATRLVLRLTRAKPITREDEPELWRAVENLSLAAGLPTPNVYVIESHDPNAFAVGLDPEHADVVVTRGLLGLLDRRGLYGVIAHELSHIGNQDTRLNTVLAAVLAVLRLPLTLLTRGPLKGNPLVIKGCLFLSALMAGMAAMLVLAIIAEIALALWFFSDEARDFLATTTRGNVLGLVLIGMMIFYGPLFMGSPFYVLFGAQRCGRRVGGAVSRQREFLADADAILLTRDPEGLALALVKVGAASGAAMNLPRAAAHLFLVEPLLPETGWWDRGVASHPPLEERVAVLARMGSGISPEALQAAHIAGVTFRQETPRGGGSERVQSQRPVADADARSRGAGVGALGVTVQLAEKLAAPPEQIGGSRSPKEPATPLLPSADVVSYIRVGEGSAVLYERPDSASAVQARLATGAVLALRGVVGDFLWVETSQRVAGYLPRSTPVSWGTE
jgi:heat shock protein HtpX